MIFRSAIRAENRIGRLRIEDVFESSVSRSCEEMHDRARSEYAAGATWHDLHAFASARTRGEPST
jgi:predicted pyridoxine 5'-phosphate oxidase superfamily flavin-nucleotide-binding protein